MRSGQREGCDGGKEGEQLKKDETQGRRGKDIEENGEESETSLECVTSSVMSPVTA